MRAARGSNVVTAVLLQLRQLSVGGQPTRLERTNMRLQVMLTTLGTWRGRLSCKSSFPTTSSVHLRLLVHLSMTSRTLHVSLASFCVRDVTR